MQPSATEDLKFLHLLKSKGFSYSIINSARSASSVFITIEGIEAGNPPLICQYMKGHYNTNPSLPKYSFTWDVGYCSEILKWVAKQSKTRVIWKTSYIISNFCGQRSKEILAVMDFRNICLNPLSANLTKWSNTLKQFLGKLPANCLGVFDHFVGLAQPLLKISSW